MFGFGSPAQAQAPQGGPQPYKPSPFDIAMDVLFHGHTPADAAMAVRGRDLAVQRNEQLMGLLAKDQQDHSPQAQDEYRALLLSGTPLGNSYAERFKPQNVEGGHTLYNTVGGGQTTAPLLQLDPVSGKGVSLTPDGQTVLGPSLGGGYAIDAESGAEHSPRTGFTGNAASRFHIIPPGNTGSADFPGISAPNAVQPGQPGQAGPPMAQQPGENAHFGNTQAPRGIRNNNFGNLMALPHGQKWDGQVGVDQAGYAVFETPHDGVKAAATNLNSYATKHGLNTVSGIISRWAPASAGNATQNYIKAVANGLGVKPDQQLNMADPSVREGLLKGIFAFENGPKAMGGMAPAGPPMGGPQVPQMAQAGQGISRAASPPVMGKTPEIVAPDDPLYGRYAPGTVLKKSPTGEITADTSNAYGPEQTISLHTKLLDSEPVKNFDMANTAYGAMVRAAAQPNGGMRAYALRDTFARLINPGAVARVGTIQAIESAQGIPANIKAYLMNVKGDGNVPPEIAQQILDVSHGFLVAHHAAAKSLNDNYGEFAKRKKMDPADVQAPGIGDAPAGRMHLGPVPQNPAEREPGAVYATPKGPLVWTGKGAKPWKAFQ